MPSVQELVRNIKKSRGKWFVHTGNLPSAWCMRIEHQVETYRPNSHLWRSHTPGHTGEYPDHYVAVIGTRGRSGVAVQFSGKHRRDREIVLGSVADIHDEPSVMETLKRLTERSGWVKKY